MSFLKNPLPIDRKKAVILGMSSSECGSCGANILRSNTCEECGEEMIFLVSQLISSDNNEMAESLSKKKAEERGLLFVGYDTRGGICLSW